MKRFYCTLCNKIKHVRRMPASVQNPQEKNPLERKGICNWHTAAPYYTAEKLNRKVSA